MDGFLKGFKMLSSRAYVDLDLEAVISAESSTGFVIPG